MLIQFSSLPRHVVVALQGKKNIKSEKGQMEKIKKEKRAFKVEKSATSFINVKITHKYPVMSIHSLIHRLIFLVDIVVQRQCHLFPGFAEYIFFYFGIGEEKSSVMAGREILNKMKVKFLP